jgi:ABC-2 type transport system ATP-binding protein
MKAIRAEKLSKTYWFHEKEAGIGGSLKALFSGRKVYVDAVREIDLDIGLGEIVGFIGPNGAGKTTTLKMLAGILHPTAGSLEVMGHTPSRREKNFLKNITLVTGQRNRLFWDLPAREYFDFCRVTYEIPSAAYRRSVDSLVGMAGIGEILDVPQRKLSAGQRKRCELVAAFLHNPSVIFLDEPTNALDLVNARRIREFIRETGRENRHTVILTSHNMADIEQVCERIIVINRGRIAFDGKAVELYNAKGHKKQIRIVFDGPVSTDTLGGLGTIRRINGQEVRLEVDADRAAAVASHLFSNHPVRDIGIGDLPLEEIIESIYRE